MGNKKSTPWQSKVPAHWSIIPIGSAVSKKKKVIAPTLPTGAISFGKVILKKEAIPDSTRATYQEVLPGDILVNPLNLNYDLKSLRIALSLISVCVSPGYFVMRPRETTHPTYLAYALHVFDVTHMKTLGAGIRQTVTYDLVAKELIALPPLPEQVRIADFLDRKTATIDVAIANKQELIAALAKYREAVIAEAVAPREGWRTTASLSTAVKLKRVARIQSGDAISKKDMTLSGGIPVFGANGQMGFTSAPNFPLGAICVGRVGSCGAVNAHDYPVFISDNALVVKPLSTLDKSYLKYMLTSINYAPLINQGAMPLLTGSGLAEVKVTVLPLTEQVRIADFLNRKTAAIDAASVRAEKAVAMLKDYRASLISEAVTGKLTIPE